MINNIFIINKIYIISYISIMIYLFIIDYVFIDCTMITSLLLISGPLIGLLLRASFGTSQLSTH